MFVSDPVADAVSAVPPAADPPRPAVAQMVCCSADWPMSTPAELNSSAQHWLVVSVAPAVVMSYQRLATVHGCGTGMTEP